MLFLFRFREGFVTPYVDNDSEEQSFESGTRCGGETAMPFPFDLSLKEDQPMTTNFLLSEGFFTRCGGETDMPFFFLCAPLQ
jgi:hypothetical protein